jgi:hypothetical protein
MEIALTFRYGPFDIEIEGNKEEVESDLVEFVEFLQENEEPLRGMESLPVNEEETETEQSRLGELEEHQVAESETETTERDTISYGDIPNRTGLDRQALSEYFDIDSEGQEPPHLNFDTELLGDSRKERQMRGSLILLTLWRECNDAEDVRSPQLKDALHISGIDDEHLYAMFNHDEYDRYFRREGSGANTDISLTMSGKRNGFDQIEEAIERLERDETEE